MSTLPVSLSEAILGAKEKVPTPSGAVTMTVPKWANAGSVLRLKGKGVPVLTAAGATNWSRSKSCSRKARSGTGEIRRPLARCLQPTPSHGDVILET
jgi:DnaJ-class molecular chaperone